MLTFGSLFTGIGGFDLGFERAGMRCKWQVEIDPYCQRVLAKHWPHVRRWDDVRTFPPEPVDEWRVDVICGGFPCQDISYAGKGAGLSGERSGLFYDLIRVVRTLGPRLVVLENVAALLTRGLDAVLGTLAEIGLDAEWHCIPAAAVGAEHYRDRVFVLARNTDSNDVDSFGGSQKQRKKAATSRSSGRKDTNEVQAADTTGIRTLGHQPTEATGNSGSVARRICVGGIDRHDYFTTEPCVGRVADGIPARMDRLRCLGNAVVPQVAEWIGRRIVEATTQT